MVYRLLGSHVVDRFGVNPTGRNFYDVIDPALVERCHAKPHGIYLHWEFQNQGGAVYDVENVVLPFLDESEMPTFFIGYCEFLEMLEWNGGRMRALAAPTWREFPLFDQA